MPEYTSEQEVAIESFAEESRFNLVVSKFEDIMPGTSIALGGMAVLSAYGMYASIQAGKPLAALGFAAAGAVEGWGSYKVGKATFDYFEVIRESDAGQQR